MRITNNMLANTTLANLNLTMERLARLQDELTSGQKISSPSDDPLGTAAALEFRSTLGDLDQYLRNVEAATSWLGATDSALESATGILQRARELAIQGASDAASAANKVAMASEVSQLIEQAISVGNFTYNGQFIFAGTKVNTTPFSAVGSPPTSVTYNGNGAVILRQTGAQATVAVNTAGDAAFADMFTALIGLRDALVNGDSLAVSAQITNVDGAIDTVITTRAEEGARINRLEQERGVLSGLKVNIAGLLSKVQDVDMTEAITEFSLQENVYKAALAAGAKAIPPSLLDYLR